MKYIIINDFNNQAYESLTTVHPVIDEINLSTPKWWTVLTPRIKFSYKFRQKLWPFHSFAWIPNVLFFAIFGQKYLVA